MTGTDFDLAVSMRSLITCPLCRRMFEDPCIISTCQHCFCFACINVGIENGCSPCALPYDDNDEDAVCTSSTPRNQSPKSTKRRRAKKVTFACPVCGLAAYKWMLQRVPTLSAFVNRVRHQMALLPPPDTKRVDRVAEKSDVVICSQRRASKGPSEPDGSRGEQHVDVASKGATSQRVHSSGHTNTAASLSSSMALFEDSLPLWSAAPPTESANAFRCAAAPVLGDKSVESEQVVGSWESSIVSFLRTPPPLPPLDARDASQPILPANPPITTSEPTELVLQLATPPQPSSAAHKRGDGSTASRPSELKDSPIQHVHFPVRLLIDESILSLAEPSARGRYVTVIQHAVAHLGGHVVNPDVAGSLIGDDAAGVPRIALSIAPATHCVCLLSCDRDAPQPSVSLCEVVAARTCASEVLVVGMEWVVASLDEGAWISTPDARWEQQYVCRGIANVGAWPSLLPSIVAPQVACRLDSVGVILSSDDSVAPRYLRSVARVVALLGATVWVASDCKELSGERHQFLLCTSSWRGDAVVPECLLFRQESGMTTLKCLLVLACSSDECDVDISAFRASAALSASHVTVPLDIPVVRRHASWLPRWMLSGAPLWEQVCADLVHGRLAEAASTIRSAAKRSRSAAGLY